MARRHALALGIALAAACLVAGRTPARAEEITERVAVDPVSGIAIFGYDPIGYFLEGRPVAGRTEFEFRWQNAVWRFASKANLEEFSRAPDVFAPAYGGYDADAVSRGVAAMPDPTIFLLVDDRLFLFRTTEARRRFVEDENAVVVADDAWPKLAATLRP
ncbi:MAG: YHS domain-containing (seleno)protein [Alsobacter sp.]